MYLGTNFHEFWSRCGEKHIHPDDQPFLAAYEAATPSSKSQDAFQTVKYLPCPFDGPLEKAKVIVCLSNPNYPKGEDDYRDVISRQRSGEELLPEEWDSKYYKKIARSLALPVEEIRGKVAVFNVCPYASKNLNEPEKKIAAGLPSVWAAQKFLREELLPRAKTGNIYLVILRKHELWGVTEGFELGNVRVIRNHARDGSLPLDVGAEIKSWMIKKGHITNLSRCES